MHAAITWKLCEQISAEASVRASQPASWFMPSEMLAVICRPIVYYLATIISNEAYVYISFLIQIYVFHRLRLHMIVGYILFTHMYWRLFIGVFFLSIVWCCLRIRTVVVVRRGLMSPFLCTSSSTVRLRLIFHIKFERESFQTKNQMDCRIEMNTYIWIWIESVSRICTYK